MQTDTVFAYQVEPGDFLLVVDPEPVVAVDEDGDVILISAKDDDGDVTQYPYGPFDSVTIVTVLDEDVEFEDVPVED